MCPRCWPAGWCGTSPRASSPTSSISPRRSARRSATRSSSASRSRRRSGRCRARGGSWRWSGPTGVGKTTTVAKLAANFKLAHGARVGLVTVDTYRIAAVEQLKTYAEIIDLPLAVVNDPAEMPRALDELGDVDLVFIDTAGRSPRDEVKIRELAEFLRRRGRTRSTWS